MYHAKSSGRDNTQLYSPSLTARIVDRMALDASLRAALDRNEFHLLYQPQIDVASGRMLSVEALIRWEHPTRGLVSPLEFIAAAEKIGLIERIGTWVLRTACADAVRWARAGTPLRVAVNLSPLQFTPRLPHRVIDALDESGLDPALLELEVTEGALMDNSAATMALLDELGRHGVRIALDDFGTGYSSLAYLTRMPISNIKIDKCFVTDLLGGGQSAAIVRAVRAMASSLGMSVTAEGVENLEQAQLLKAISCDFLQGYYFSRPVAPVRVPELATRRWSLAGAPDTERDGSLA